MKTLLTFLGLAFGIAAFGQLDTVNIGTGPGNHDGEILYTAFLKVNNAIDSINGFRDKFTTDTLLLGDSTITEMYEGVIPDTSWVGNRVSSGATSYSSGNLISIDSDVIGVDSILTSSSELSIEDLNTISYSFGESISLSSDGQYIFYVRYRDYFLSDDYGVSWTSLPAMGDYYRGGDISDNGQYLTVVSEYTEILRSVDYGASWTTELSGGQAWTDVAVSGNGQYQLAAVGYGNVLYRSADFGDSWAATTSPSVSWDFVDINYDGQYQTGVANTGRIYRSTDYGVTWAEVGPATNYSWYGVAVSTTGQYQSAVSFGNSVYISDDYGATWTESTSEIENFRAISMSGDGQYQYAVAPGQPLNYSDDYGASWTELISDDYRTTGTSSDGTLTALSTYTGILGASFKSSLTINTDSLLVTTTGCVDLNTGTVADATRYRFEKDGLTLNNYSSASWTDDNLITKGYADANYSDSSWISATADTIKSIVLEPQSNLLYMRGVGGANSMQCGFGLDNLYDVKVFDDASYGNEIGSIVLGVFASNSYSEIQNEYNSNTYSFGFSLGEYSWITNSNNITYSDNEFTIDSDAGYIDLLANDERVKLQSIHNGTSYITLDDGNIELLSNSNAITFDDDTVHMEQENLKAKTVTVGDSLQVDKIIANEITGLNKAGRITWTLTDVTNTAEEGNIKIGALHSAVNVDRLIVGSDTLQSSVSSAIARIDLIDGNGAGGTINYTVVIKSAASDSIQVQTGEIKYSSLNVGASYSSSIDATDVNANYTENIASTTLTEDWTITTGTNQIFINANFTTNIGVSSIRIYYEISNQSRNGILIQ